MEKFSAWKLTKVKSKKQVIDEARMSGATVHFASLMDICHLKNAELEAKHQKYKGRVVLRGDIVKDNSGSYAVFTEQGSSASQMTAAKIMDFISRLPGCDGQAADAVSAYTQVKMEDAHKLLKIPKSECPAGKQDDSATLEISTPCIDDHHFEEETKSVGELSHACSQLVPKSLYLARIGRLDILWSGSKLARSITKWTKACDDRRNRLISFIHHTFENKQYCHVGNTTKQCRLGLFQDSDFAGDLED